MSQPFSSTNVNDVLKIITAYSTPDNGSTKHDAKMRCLWVSVHYHSKGAYTNWMCIQLFQFDVRPEFKVVTEPMDLWKSQHYERNSKESKASTFNKEVYWKVSERKI